MKHKRLWAAGNKRAHRCDKGITILELLLSTSLSIVLMLSLVVLYYSSAKTAAREENLSSASRDAKLVTRRLAHEFRLVGLLATADANGDANDINRDVPSQVWSDSIRDDVEYATTYQIAFTSDIDNDGRTETTWLRLSGDDLLQQGWEWSRTTVRWGTPTTRVLALNVDYILLDYYDKDMNRIPQPSGYLSGGFELASSDRRRVRAIEITVVLRSSTAENVEGEALTLPDGHTFHDNFRRSMFTFMIRGRNLS